MRYDKISVRELSYKIVVYIYFSSFICCTFAFINIRTKQIDAIASGDRRTISVFQRVRLSIEA